MSFYIRLPYETSLESYKPTFWNVFFFYIYFRNEFYISLYKCITWHWMEDHFYHMMFFCQKCWKKNNNNKNNLYTQRVKLADSRWTLRKRMYSLIIHMLLKKQTLHGQSYLLWTRVAFVYAMMFQRQQTVHRANDTVGTHYGK